jgi:hypothetical protein
MRINVHDVDVVEGLHEVGARNDLAGFVEGDLREGELGGKRGVGGFEVDEGAGEDYSGGLGCSVSEC